MFASGVRDRPVSVRVSVIVIVPVSVFVSMLVSGCLR